MDTVQQWLVVESVKLHEMVSLILKFHLNAKLVLLSPLKCMAEIYSINIRLFEFNYLGRDVIYYLNIQCG